MRNRSSSPPNLVSRLFLFVSYSVMGQRIALGACRKTLGALMVIVPLVGIGLFASIAKAPPEVFASFSRNALGVQSGAVEVWKEELANEVTVFTLLRRMDERTKSQDNIQFVHQMNAISSWKRIVNPKNIIVFTQDSSSCQYIESELGVRCQMDSLCVDPNYNRPMMNCIWNLARNMSQTRFMTFVNGDIMIFDDFLATIEKLKGLFGDYFLMVGQRKDLDVDNVIDFDKKDVVKDFLGYAERSGTYHGEWGIDYFVLGSKIWEEKLFEFPDFLAGVFRWDNWLLSECIINNKIQVVDATQSVDVIHQDVTDRLDHWNRSGADYNDALSKSISGQQYRIGNVYFADWNSTGKCSTGCTVIPNNNRDLNLLKIFQKVNSNLTLTVLIANSDRVPSILNWICWVNRIGFSNFVVVAEDMYSHRALSKHNVSLILLKDVVYKERFSPMDLDYAKKIATARLQFLYDIVYNGLNFLLIDSDSVWIRDMTELVDSAMVIRRFSPPADVLSVQTLPLFLRSGSIGKNLWINIQRCMESRLRKLTMKSSIDMEIQSCIDSVIKNFVKKKVLSSSSWQDNQVVSSSLLAQQSFKHSLQLNSLYSIEGIMNSSEASAFWSLSDSLVCTFTTL